MSESPKIGTHSYCKLEQKRRNMENRLHKSDNIIAINIWQFHIDNEYGTTEKSREQNMQTQLRPKIEKAHAISETILACHSHLLQIPLERRLLSSSKTNKCWLQHISVGNISYHRCHLKALLNITKITHFFLTKNTKKYPPISNIKHSNNLSS